MFNLQQFNEERGALFDEAFPHKIAQVRRGDGHALQGYYNIPIKSFLTESHTLLLKRFLEGEVDRLEKAYKEEYYSCARPPCSDIYDRMCEHVGEWKGYNQAVKDQINYYKSLIDTL